MALATGDEAPDFTHARTKTETNDTLSSLRGTQNVVLIFSPFTFTGASSARSATTVEVPEGLRRGLLSARAMRPRLRAARR
jgi:hypothetical protein